MVVAIFPFPFELPGSLHHHEGLVGVVGVHHHALPGYCRDIGHAEAGFQMGNLWLGLITDGRIGLASFGLFEPDRVAKCAVIAFDRLVGQPTIDR